MAILVQSSLVSILYIYTAERMDTNDLYCSTTLRLLLSFKRVIEESDRLTE